MEKRNKARPPMFRHDKGEPCQDMWRTLRLGLPLALVLFIVLPFILNG